ncbi:hypothetical protein ACVW0P_000303 [Mucilaginibacter sp. UYNi724]
MDKKESTFKDNLSVPEQIFQIFFEDLKLAGISSDVISQLQLAISEKENPSDIAIKAALLSHNTSV